MTPQDDNAHKIALRAMKIALVACAIMIISVAFSLWVSLHQVSAVVSLTKTQKDHETRLQTLESTQKTLN